jgi:lipoate---protein ligase
MTRLWRLLATEDQDDSFMKMAVDETILNSVGSGSSPPTLRFYSWKRPAVSLGYFQSIGKEIDVDACRRDNIEIFRRMTGGGAVYKDPGGELNYSLVVSEEHVPINILESYSKINEGVIEGLRRHGLSCQHSGINDIIISGKKISGNAQTRRHKAVLQHGTILVDFDAEKMATYLKISAAKLSDKGIMDIRQRVGTLKEHIPSLSQNDVIDSIVLGFSHVFGAHFAPGDLTEQEREEAGELYGKYSSVGWVHWR